MEKYLKKGLPEPVFRKWKIPELEKFVQKQGQQETATGPNGNTNSISTDPSTEKNQLSNELILNHQKIVEILSWYKIELDNLLGKLFETRELQKKALSDWLDDGKDLSRFDWDFVELNRDKKAGEITITAQPLSYREVCQKLYKQAKTEFSTENLDFLFDLKRSTMKEEIIQGDKGLNCGSESATVNVDSVTRKSLCLKDKDMTQEKQHADLVREVKGLIQKDTLSRVKWE